MVTIFFYWRKELLQADLSYTFYTFVKLIENFLVPFEKTFQPKKAGFQKMKLKIRLEYSDKTPLFGLKLFLKRPLENFLWTLRTFSRYLGDLPNLVLCVSKKIVTTRHTNKQILAKKKQRFFQVPLTRLQ